MDISIELLSRRFEKHLDVEENHRIIVSGRFGIGKTYFLNKFFDDRKEQYNKILIAPVNYVVNSNEDIFELIKADIIKELFLTRMISPKSLPKDTLLQEIGKYFEENPLALPRFMAKTLAKINPIAETPLFVIEQIGNIIGNFKTKHKVKQRQEKTREEEVSDYLDEGEQKLGTIYEHNYITKLINTFLAEIKGEKKNVLIIDDLDRIDPDHLFRILNVFSAHNNHFGETNKFLFDHVVVVCDIHNIEKIFEHRYGIGVDFEGYIDKFFSTEIFHFSNNDSIKNYVDQTFITQDTSGKELIVLLLKFLIEEDQLSIRKLIKHQYKISVDKFLLKESVISFDNFHIQERGFLKTLGKVHIDSTDVTLLQFFKLASIVYGDFRSFRKILEKLKNVYREVVFTEVETAIFSLALNYHIINANNDNRYITKLVDSYDRRTIIGYTNPEVLMLDRKFRINIIWTKTNQYDNSQSFFKGASVAVSSNEVDKDSSGSTINMSALIVTLISVIEECHNKGYLSKAGIYYEGLKSIK